MYSLVPTELYDLDDQILFFPERKVTDRYPFHQNDIVHKNMIHIMDSILYLSEEPSNVQRQTSSSISFPMS